MLSLLLLTACLALVWWIVLAICGGLSLAVVPVTIGSHSAWVPLAVAGALSGAALAVFGGRAVAETLERWWGGLERHAARLAAVVAIVACLVGWRWGSFIAGGSDSYCYIAQAESLARGHLVIDQPLARSAPWPNAIQTLTPGGYRPSPVAAAAIVPICPPGLSLTIAPFWRVFGPASVGLIVVLLGGLAVWLTFLIGRRVGCARAGLVAAVLLATSPILLYQIVQPMSDVPATAWWLASTALALRPGRSAASAAGLMTSMALLTRPNLAPLAAVVAAMVWQSAGAAREARPTTRPTMEATLKGRPTTAVMLYLLGVVPGCVAIVWIQTVVHGSPFASGYGTTSELFDAARIPVNLRRYLGWLVDTETPLVALAAVAPIWATLTGRPATDRPPAASAAMDRPAAIWLLVVFFLVTLASYLPYQVFDVWWYLRFLLPGLPHLLILVSIVFVTATRRLPPATRMLALVLATTMLAATHVATARDRSAFRLYDLERRFADAGRYVADHLPPRAILITSWQSGSVRHYSGRPTVLWDALDAQWLDRALTFVRRNGYVPYLLLEGWEEPTFRTRFEGRSAIGGLDWPPLAQIGREVRIYNPADRQPYLAGASIRTDRVWPR